MSVKDMTGWSDDVIRFYEKWYALRDIDEERAPMNVVEVGVAYGKSLARLAELAAPRDCVVGVDLFPDFWGRELPNYAALTEGAPSPMHALHREFNRHAQHLIGRWSLVWGDSPVVATFFPDRSLDLVFIDGDHSRDAVAADLAAWLPKVRPGGTLAGHDYSPEGRGAMPYGCHPGVVRAVDEFMGERRMVFDLHEVDRGGSVWSTRVP